MWLYILSAAVGCASVAVAAGPHPHERTHTTDSTGLTLTSTLGGRRLPLLDRPRSLDLPPHRHPGSPSGCSIADFGAVPGNRTTDAARNTAAISAALVQCERVDVPSGSAFKVLPFVIPSHRVLHLEAGASLVGSDVWQDYGITAFMPRMGRALQLRPLISATNATNITITGLNGTIDGNGWFAWPSANWSSPECGLRRHCAGSTFFGNASVPLRPPHTITFIGCTDVTLTNVTVTK